MKLLLIVLFTCVVNLCFAQTHNLNFFIQQAKQNSPVIKDYQNQILSAQIDSQLLKASLHTQVNFINSNSYAPIINGWGYDEAISNIANISALIQANRNFLTKSNITLQYQSIALQR